MKPATEPSDPAYHHRLVVGYHGCERELGESVLLGRAQLPPSANDYDWLGGGVYFWEHGFRRALEWAQQNRRDPFVLGAGIQLGRCLDLTDTWATASLGSVFDRLKAILSRQGLALPENRVGKGATGGDRLVRNLDCAVINLLNEIEDQTNGRLYYQSVRGVFEEGDDAFPGACVKTKTHIQLAVRDSRCILGYFLPLICWEPRRS